MSETTPQSEDQINEPAVSDLPPSDAPEDSVPASEAQPPSTSEEPVGEIPSEPTADELTGADAGEIDADSASDDEELVVEKVTDSAVIVR